MLKLTINENEYLLAEEWKDVTYGQYVDVLIIQENKYDDLEKAIKMVAALSSNPKELELDLYDLTLDEIKELCDSIKWINSEFINEAKTVEIKKEFNIDGRKFCIKANMDKLSAGEMISLEETLKNPNIHSQEAAIAILIREIDENGKEKKFDTDLFYEILEKLKYKFYLVDLYNYVENFTSGDKESTKTSKGFLVTRV